MAGMSADLILYIGLACLAIGLVALALWHAARRSPLIFFGTDALYLMAAIEILVPAARMMLAA